VLLQLPWQVKTATVAQSQFATASTTAQVTSVNRSRQQGSISVLDCKLQETNGWLQTDYYSIKGNSNEAQWQKHILFQSHFAAFNAQLHERQISCSSKQLPACSTYTNPNLTCSVHGHLLLQRHLRGFNAQLHKREISCSSKQLTA
jgi:hypothetical protein